MRRCVFPLSACIVTSTVAHFRTTTRKAISSQKNSLSCWNKFPLRSGHRHGSVSKKSNIWEQPRAGVRPGWTTLLLPGTPPCWGWSATGIEQPWWPCCAAARHGLVLSCVPQVWVPIPWRFPCGGRNCYWPLKEPWAIEHKVRQPYPPSLIVCYKVCFHHVQPKTMSTLPLAPELLLYCITNAYLRGLSSVSASEDTPLSLNIPLKHYLTPRCSFTPTVIFTHLFSCKWVWQIAVSWTLVFFHWKRLTLLKFQFLTILF